MTIEEPKTDPAIPFDADIEGEIEDVDTSPGPGHAADRCSLCRAVVLVRIRNDVRPPGCEREALAFLTCVSTQDGRWGLCAARYQIRLGGYLWYFGPERRSGPLRDPPAGVIERRGKIPPPFDPAKAV